MAVLTVLRLLVSAVSPMAPDEAYYWVWSRALAPGYFDHPPMVAVWIWLGTALAGDGNLGVRLLGPIAAALGSVLLVRAGDDLLPGRHAGLIAAGLLNATLLFGVGSTTMTPDTPLLLFWTATLWALARLHATGKGWWWLVAGACAGLALDSKYTAALLAPAILLWLVAAPAMRPWLRRPQPWLAALVAALLFSPVLAWNAAHGWVSFAKQGARAADWDPGRDLGRALQFVGELLGGQLGLATPLVAVLCAAGIGLAVRRAFSGGAAWILLAAFSALPALVFVQHALGDRVQANWPSIIYPAAAIAAAALTGRLASWRKPAMALGFSLTALVWIQAAAAPLALPMRFDPTLLRLGGWEPLATELAALAKRDDASFIASDNYGHAALLARLLPHSIPVLGVEARWATFNLPDAGRIIDGRTGLLLRSARRDDAPDPARWSEIVRLDPLERARSGMTAEGFRLYRVTGRPGDTPMVVMPRPR